MNSSSRRHRDLIHTAIFLVAILLPLVGMGLRVNDDGFLAENRRLSPLPDIPSRLADWVGLPGAFQSYFDDHFGFRSHLIGSNALLVWYGSRQSVPVTVGRDGWLFSYRRSEVLRYRCMELTRKDQEAWAGLGRERARRIGRHGAHFLWVLAPNKHSVYPEFLPDELRAEACHPSPPLGEAGTAIDFLDLRPGLIADKGEIPIYHRTDSHWNQLGALLAARRIVGHLRQRFPALSMPSIDDFEIRVRHGVPGGDMARRLRIYREDHREDLVFVTPRRPYTARPVEGSGPLDPFRHTRAEQVLTVETGRDDLPTAVVFHDSFMYPMMPILADHFRRVRFVHTRGPIDEEVVAAESPDIVIVLYLESKLARPLPRDHWL